MEPVAAPEISQPILTDEDRLEMQPLLPPIPQECLMEFGTDIMPTSAENLSTSLLTRSRYAYASTPLKDYRHQLPPIDEEQHQRPTTMGRVLELSEHCPPPTPPRPSVAPNESAVDGVAAPPAAELQLTPCRPRDWSSIFRPRNYMPSYEGLDIEQEKPKQKRRRRVPVQRTDNTPEAPAPEPRSNHEITTHFLADLLQSALQDEPPSRQADIDEGRQSEERLNPPATNMQLAESDLELPQDLALPKELPAVVGETAMILASKVNQVMETELPQVAIGGALWTPAAEPCAEVTEPSAEAAADPSAKAPTGAEPLAEAAAAAAEPSAVAVTAIESLPMEVDLPFPSVSLDELPDRPVVTSMFIVYTPSEKSLQAGKQQLSLTGMTSECPTSAHITASTRLMEDSITTQDINVQKEKTAHQQNDEQRIHRERFYRENLNDLDFVVKHTEKLRLMVDHQKQLSDEQQQQRQPPREYSSADFCPADETESERADGSRSRRYISLPAVYTYDPRVILDMPAVKLRVAHSLMAAIIMQPTVDMRSLSFITCRMEAAIAYRIILELKTAGIVNLSKDARFASLR